MTVKYKIIVAGTLYDLEIKVNKALKEGWTLIGGPQISGQFSSGLGGYMQAMIY